MIDPGTFSETQLALAGDAARRPRHPRARDHLDAPALLAAAKADPSLGGRRHHSIFDISQYIHLENIPIVPLYFAAPRPTVERDGLLLMVDDDRFRLRPGEVPAIRSIRFAPSAATR